MNLIAAVKLIRPVNVLITATTVWIAALLSESFNALNHLPVLLGSIASGLIAAFGNIHNHEPRRRRKILLHGREIRRLAGKLAEKGLTLVPLRLYFKRGRAKVELALGRGRKLHDKRESLKRDVMRREVERALHGGRDRE